MNIVFLGGSAADVDAVSRHGFHPDSKFLHVPTPGPEEDGANCKENLSFVRAFTALPDPAIATLVLEPGTVPYGPGWDIELQTAYHDSQKLFATTPREPGAELVGPVIFPPNYFARCPVARAIASSHRPWRQQLRYETGTADSFVLPEHFFPAAAPVTEPVNDAGPDPAPTTLPIASNAVAPDDQAAAEETPVTDSKDSNIEVRSSEFEASKPSESKAPAPRRGGRR